MYFPEHLLALHVSNSLEEQLHFIVVAKGVGEAVKRLKLTKSYIDWSLRASVCNTTGLVKCLSKCIGESNVPH